MLHDLIRLETRHAHLTKIAYDWCSAICENRQILPDWESLLLTCLEIGFRHLDPQDRLSAVVLTHTEHRLEMVDVVFKSRKSETIADLLHAWVTGGTYEAPTYTLLGFCIGHLVGLHDVVPFSPRLRRLVIRSVECIGYGGFERVGVERFVELLNHLRVTVEDMNWKSVWIRHLLDTLQSSEAAQNLSPWYWELLVELGISELPLQGREIPYSPQIVSFLTEAQEWIKLECWIGIVWMVWPPGAGGMIKKDFDRSMVLLFRQRPGAAQKLKHWIEQWSERCGKDIPKSFQQIYKQAHGAAQRDAL